MKIYNKTILQINSYTFFYLNMTTSIKYFTTEYVQETFQIFNDIFNKEGMLTNLLTQRRKKRYDHSGKS